MTAAQASKMLPRENLCRSVPFTVTRSEDGGSGNDGFTFTGYGAVFNSPTRIDSWEGCFDEQIAPGAFRKSLRERTPKFQFDHGRHPLIGSVPIGAITDIGEDEQGLRVEARLGRHMLIDFIREALTPPDLGGTGAIDGMSFRFDVVRDEWVDVDGKTVRPDDVRRILYYGEQPERAPLLRTLKEVKVSEVGPVVWPAYSGTSASVRSANEPIVIYPDRLNEPEQRRLLGEAVLRAEALDAKEISPSPNQGGPSDEEPQSTPDRAGEHSDEDTTDAPQSTPDGAGEHADEAPQATSDEAGEHADAPTETPPTDDVDAARAAEQDRLFREALNEVTNQREAHPPMTIRKV